MSREDVLTHLRIMHTWATFALEKKQNFFTSNHMKNIAQWTEDALALLKEQEAYGWRLCSDELPENNDEVLVTYIVNGNQKKRYVETASYFNYEDIDGYWNSVWDEYRLKGTKTEVIAWMPLPKPYKEGQ